VLRCYPRKISPFISHLCLCMSLPTPHDIMSSSDTTALPPPTDDVLSELRARILSLSEHIKSLKASSDDGDKDAITTAVAQLVDAKRSYAANNGGLDMDNKPYVESMSKSEKKKLEKEAKAKQQQGLTTTTTPVVSTGEETSKGAARKAAKKAEAKIKKAAMNQQSDKTTEPTTMTVTNGGRTAITSPSTSSTATTNSNKVKNQQRTTTTTTTSSFSNIKLLPNQIVMNPNDKLTDRPIVALTTAILLNVIVDYDLVSDHSRVGCALGIGGPRSGGGGGVVAVSGEVCGDMAMARYIARTSPMAGRGLLWSTSSSWMEEAAIIDQWVDYATCMSKMELTPRSKALAIHRTLDPVLHVGTYITGHMLTLADLACFAALGFPATDKSRADIESHLPPGCATLRWMDTIASHPAVREATQLALGISGKDEAILESNAVLDPIMVGMNYLEGATPGNITVRFPPEPSGYLHVGHAKAVLLSDYYARRYGGRLILRFDDTNPSKEKDEYQGSIVEDLGKIGVRPDIVTFTSDYFGTIEKYALWMMANGYAYMDDTPQELMQKERMERQNSKHRNQSPDEALRYFNLMKSGSEDGKVWCLRAKIDMSSDNGTMRDPVLYRQNITPHHRSGTTYKAYPTYDLACPIVDSIEGVTHALRTTEYDDRNAQFAWIQRVLGLRRVRIQTFARVNFMYTVMSKRKLAWFVDTGRVTGWDDPRFPTVRGVTRRGIDIDALKRFMCSQGASRRVVNMEWNKFWAENKKHIDLYAKRFMAVDKVDTVTLTVTNATDGMEFMSTEYLPKDPSFGTRLVRIGKNVLLEKVDTEGMEIGEEIVLIRWGVVRLTKVDGGLEGLFIPDGDIKAAKRKLSWLVNVPENTRTILAEFDNLILKEKLEEDDKIEDCLNPHTQAETEVIGDAGLKKLKENDIIQLERRGYYRVDRPYINETKPLILFMVPDGKKSSMGGLEGKLAHR